MAYDTYFDYKKNCDDNAIEYYLYNFFGIIIFYFIYTNLEKVNLVNRYLFGILNKN